MNGAPRVAVSMGDPTGIGPEVTLAALLRAACAARSQPILVGDLGIYGDAAAPARPAGASPSGSRRRPAAARRARRPRGHDLPARQRRPGRPSLAGGRAAHAAIVEAVRLVRAGSADALVTAPICKANLVAAGLPVSGHTELLAAALRRRPGADDDGRRQPARRPGHHPPGPARRPGRLRRSRWCPTPLASPTAPCASGSAFAAPAARRRRPQPARRRAGRLRRRGDAPHRAGRPRAPAASASPPAARSPPTASSRSP